ncbi:MAG: metallophosphoesterase [Clostridia bacterium]|nr:metallophosphoesterase [Clostridia bacterium]
MAVWTIADLHLAHAVNKPMNKFGRRWTGHTEKIESRWRALVENGDTVIVPGDISWGMTLDEARDDLAFIDRLPGKKLLSRGNHDYWWASLAKMHALCEAEGFTTLEFMQNSAHPVENLILAGSRGWYIEQRLQNTPMPTDYEKIVARECLRLGMSLDEADKLKTANPDAETIVFLHFPPVFGDFICEPLVEVLKSRGIRDCYFGHIHGVYNVPGNFEYEGIRMHLISADFLDFYPVKVG